MTKPITGVATMMLVERGELGLDQPIIDVVPEWRTLHVAIDPEKSVASRPTRKTVTVRHLLTHTSGLGDWAPSAGSGPLPILYRERGITPGNRGTRLERPGYGPQAKDLAEMMKRIAELPLATEPGAAFQYSTIGYAILGLVIERISGNTLDVYFRERIFEPLGMTSTGFQVQPRQTSQLTTNYDVTPTGLVVSDAAESSAWLVRPTLLDGGGGLISTARDFARFSTMLLNEGTLEGTQVLRPDTARRARSNMLPPGITARSNDLGYGAGMSVALTEQGKRFRAAGTVIHGGAAGTLWIADPTRRATMVFMAQHMPPSRAAVSDLATAIEADLG
jgi:CubicO group peptidase (beta-lactamase class C family)